ncbi:MAG: hypothetical protein ACRDHF_08855 [Tepidiformaceae bacterium]
MASRTRRESLPAGATSPSSQAGLGTWLGFWELLASGIGIIVGAGIYVLIGEATAEAGGLVWLGLPPRRLS